MRQANNEKQSGVNNEVQPRIFDSKVVRPRSEQLRVSLLIEKSLTELCCWRVFV